MTCSTFSRFSGDKDMSYSSYFMKTFGQFSTIKILCNKVVKLYFYIAIIIIIIIIIILYSTKTEGLMVTRTSSPISYVITKILIY